MTAKPELLALEHAAALCNAHVQALSEALEEIDQRNFAAAELDLLSKEDRRLLDQFAYRYLRLQDDMGVKLMPAALGALGEEIAIMPMIDRLSRLEQLRWIPSADEWMELRHIRNEFAHDYPESPKERLERLQLAFASANRLLELMAFFNHQIRQQFPQA